MKLNKLNDYVFYSDYEDLRDRPALGYIKADKYSVAIDAGHSDDHLNEFYNLLNQHNLPLPTLTILTHWHWDHTFAMHAVNGLTLACEKTNNHLLDFIKNQNAKTDEEFRNLDPSIKLEYPTEKQIIVKPANIIYNSEITLDLNNTVLKVFESISPHSDDCTLIYMPQEKILFYGDAISGEFPTWKADSRKKEELINTINKLEINICVGGHWDNKNKQELIDTIRQEL